MAFEVTWRYLLHFFNEWAQIAAISENLNWCSAWSAPEYRIGTYALSPHKVRKNQGLIAAASGDRALPGDYPFLKQHRWVLPGKEVIGVEIKPDRDIVIRESYHSQCE